MRFVDSVHQNFFNFLFKLLGSRKKNIPIPEAMGNLQAGNFLKY
jgi:hypothetical protein